MRRYLEDLILGRYPRRDNIQVQGIAESSPDSQTPPLRFNYNLSTLINAKFRRFIRMYFQKGLGMSFSKGWKISMA